MNLLKQQNSDISLTSEIKQRILADQVMVELLKNYTEMDDEELEKKFTLLISSKKYRNLKIKMANSKWDSAYTA
jgi:DUF4097 and DUF4098 domain-containing protein YvlB